MNRTPHDVNPNGDSPYEHLDDNTDELESCAPIARVPVGEDEADRVYLVSSRPKPKRSLTSRIGSWFDSIKESPVFSFARAVTVLVLAVTLVNWVTMNLGGCSSTTVEASETTDETKNPDETENADEATPPAQEAETSQKGDWTTYQELVNSHPDLVFHNFALQADGDSSNNANFGENRFHKDWTAQDYYKDFKEIIEEDPLVLVAAIATVDAARHTNLCGDYYDGNAHDWARTINAMVEACVDNQVDYDHLKEVFFSLLENEVRSVDVVHMDDVHDQMFVDPYTYDGIPKLVVSETHQSGDILLITFKTKGDSENDFQVGFRTQCCYQPIGVVDILNVEPEPVPVVPEHTPEPGKGGNTPQPEPDPKPTPDPDPKPTPDPEPEPEPEYNKDPEKAPQTKTESNNDPKSGSSTNNGVGATESPADQPTNSTTDSYEEYVEDIAGLEEINQNQSTGSDDDTPSTPAPSADTTADNNGSAINDYTPAAPPAEVAETGEAISSPGDTWGGPAD